jgi:hypothetical protein
MPGEFYFMAIAGLGVSLAGFAGLISALDTSPGSAVKAWRIRNIVIGGFFLTFMGFGTVATYSLTEDVDATVRIVSFVSAVLLLVRTRTEIRPGPAWPDRRGLVVALVMGLVAVALFFVNVAVASVGLLQLLLLFELTDPTSIFFFAVREISARGHEVPHDRGH